MPRTFETEIQRRLALVETLRAISPDLSAIPPPAINELNIYRPQRGIYLNEAADDQLVSSHFAMSFRHTGQHYEDELSERSLIYSYPKTKHEGRDRAEIDASKMAMQFGVPIFVVVASPLTPKSRAVRLGYVADADDRAGQFLVHFGAEAFASIIANAAPFVATVEARKKRTRVATVRANDQAKFAFNVTKQYGRKCAVCSLTVPELLDAAHIVGVANSGTDDVRNGIPLCKNHHRAFDGGLFWFEDGSFEVRVSPAHTLQTLLIEEQTPRTLTGELPHSDAIRRCNELRAPYAVATDPDLL